MSSGRVTKLQLNLRADMRTMLRSIGIEVTDASLAEARQRRLEAAARHTPERRAAWHKAVGSPPPAERGPIGIVLDTSAILAFTRGSVDVGAAVADVAEAGGRIGLPISCLVEARWRLGDLDRLNVLVHHMATELIASPGDWSVLAAALTVARRQDAASALLAAVQSGCGVLTASPRRYATLAGGSPIVPLPR